MRLPLLAAAIATLALTGAAPAVAARSMSGPEVVAVLKARGLSLTRATITSTIDFRGVDVVRRPFSCRDCVLRGGIVGDDVVFEGTLQLSGSRIAGQVLMRRATRDEGWFKRATASLFYRVIGRLADVPIPENVGDFRLLSRRAVDALKRLPERSRFMKGLYAWVGFRAVALPYTPAPRAEGKSTFNTRRLVRLAIDGLTAFTTWPLRVVSVVGLMLAVPAFAYGAFVAVEHLLFGNSVSGWTTITNSSMFGTVS